MGLRHLDPKNVQQMDSVQFIPQLREVGRTAAGAVVKPAHFDGFV
jgi:hypothetical protein